MAAALGSRAMYLVDTGAANEHVPLNETGYLLPLWQVGGAACVSGAGESCGGEVQRP